MAAMITRATKTTLMPPPFMEEISQESQVSFVLYTIFSYCKYNFPINPHARLFGRSVLHNFLKREEVRPLHL